MNVALSSHPAFDNQSRIHIDISTEILLVPF